MSRLLLLIALLPFFCTPAFAIYRCEMGGTTAYSDAPCRGGQEIHLGIDPPAAANVKQAEQQLTQEKADLQRLQKARRQQDTIEQKQQQQRARAHAAQQKKCAASALRLQWAEDDARKAAGKTAPRMVQKARRAAEKHHLECGR